MLVLVNEKDFIDDLLNPKTQNSAFEKLIDLYKRPMYYHIRSIVLNHDDADDVLQNTFLKIFKHLKSFKGDSKLFSWVYRIATNESLTFLKQKSKRNGWTSDLMQSKSIENLVADSYFNGDEIQVKLQRAILTLPPKQQLIFKMKYFNELKYEEISEILGTTVGGLKASYHHAVKKIEEFIKKN